MSNETVSIVHEPEPEYGMMHCPDCGFKIPEDIVVCWKCGKTQTGKPSYR
jgi:hypothetical protein